MGGDDVRRTEIALLEFSSDVTLDKGGLSGATITDQKHFELGSLTVEFKKRRIKYGAEVRKRAYRLSHVLIMSLRTKERQITNCV